MQYFPTENLLIGSHGTTTDLTTAVTLVTSYVNQVLCASVANTYMYPCYVTSNTYTKLCDPPDIYQPTQRLVTLSRRGHTNSIQADNFGGHVGRTNET